MGKIEKLKEINSRIINIINDLETYIFIEKININDDKIIKKYKKTIVKLKS